MDRIFYGLAGEGLGHASRTLSVIDALPDCEVHVYTFGKAYDYFANVNYPHLHKIDGIMFPYRNGKVNYAKLIWKAIQYRTRGLTDNIAQISRDADELKPKAFVTDFEPSMPRTARALGFGNKLISVDNQHRFAYCDLSDLPVTLRFYARMMGMATRMLVPRPNHAVISTFHFDTIEANRSNITLTNGLMRKDILETQPTNEGFTLVYLRESVSEKILEVLMSFDEFLDERVDFSRERFKIYGATDGPFRTMLAANPNFEFRPLSPDFVKDLTACKNIIATAGNQLISEARYCQKPILVVPEPKQYEQYINGYYVEQTGLGSSCRLNKLCPEIVESFLNNFELTASHEPNGVHKVTEVIREHL